jgi:hypothetical protein
MEAEYELSVIPGVCVKEALKILFLLRRYPIYMTININVILGRFLVGK